VTRTAEQFSVPPVVVVRSLSISTTKRKSSVSVPPTTAQAGAELATRHPSVAEALTAMGRSLFAT
jgi:hypothetical protein